MRMLFPTYLNKGTTGSAVKLLQLMLQFGGYNREIVADGEYGDQTAAGVTNLQLALGFSGHDDLDGNFGPKTRAALYAQRGIDINNISFDFLESSATAAAVMEA